MGDGSGAFTRGALRLARETTEAFLREAEAEGRPMEAGVARRALGMTCLHLGEFAEAQALLSVWRRVASGGDGYFALATE